MPSHTAAYRHSPLTEPMPGITHALLCWIAALNAAPSTLRVDTIPAHDTFTVASVALGEARRINVHRPPGSTPSTRLPVLYMPDGGLDEDFPHVVRAVDSLIAAKAIRPVMVVGIPNTQRRRDLTGPTRFASDSAVAPRVGGSAAFRAFVRDELIPAVNTRYRTTGERAIVGESLAGLFVVETFLLEPSLFTHYIALDPSIWWNGGALVAEAEARLRAFPAGERSFYLGSAPSTELPPGAAALAAHLGAAKQLRWHFEPRPELQHSTIFLALEGVALQHALR